MRSDSLIAIGYTTAIAPLRRIRNPRNAARHWKWDDLGALATKTGGFPPIERHSVPIPGQMPILPNLTQTKKRVTLRHSN
jgi:hypothetical protein